MTDAASKNLDIENGVAQLLCSDHTPYHLLFKSHTCERLDTDILSPLTEIENKINIRSKILAQEPNLKSFVGNSKSIVQVALIALLKLVSKESDGKTVSLTEQFDYILDEDGVLKSLSLYKEKRFTKLGYLAGAAYDCLPYFQKVLTETPLNNLLIQSCKLYVKNPVLKL